MKIPNYKTKIAKEKMRKAYFPDRDIAILIEKKEWVNALFMAGCRIEAYLRNILLWYLNDYRKEIKVALYRIVDEMNFAQVVRRMYLIKKITPKQKKEIDEIRNVRNDIAHNVCLTYNQNIDEKEAKRILKKALKIINELHAYIIGEQDNIK